MDFKVKVSGFKFTQSVSELKQIEGVTVGDMIGDDNKEVNIYVKLTGDIEAIKGKIEKITGFRNLAQSF